MSERRTGTPEALDKPERSGLPNIDPVELAVLMHDRGLECVLVYSHQRRNETDTPLSVLLGDRVIRRFIAGKLRTGDPVFIGPEVSYTVENGSVRLSHVFPSNESAIHTAVWTPRTPATYAPDVALPFTPITEVDLVNFSSHNLARASRPVVPGAWDPENMVD